MRTIKFYWIFVIIVIIICCNLSGVELKRSFGIGRSRPKVGNQNVRRRGHTITEPQHSVPAPNQKVAPVAAKPASESVSQPKGPPPPYSALPANSKSVPAGAPPAYSPSHVGPPSYSAAMGHSNPSSNLNYPRQAYGVNSGAGVYNSHPNFGANTGPGFSNTPYHGNYGGTGYNAYPGMGAPGGYGGYGGYGGHNSGFGGYGGGMSGMSPMAPMGYAPTRSSGLFSNGFAGSMAGGALTGLAVWQLTRGLGGGSHGHRENVYHIYNNPQQAAPAAGAVPVAEIASQGTIAQEFATAPPICTENCTNTASAEGSVPPPQVTPVPDANYQYEHATIHPSLFPYGRYDESLVYWANPLAQAINKTADASS